MLCPTPSYEHEDLWRLLTPTCKPFWVPKGATVPCHFSLELQCVPRISLYHCVRIIWSGWTQRASRFHQEKATEIFSTYSLAGGKERHGAGNNPTAGLETRPQNKQGVRGLQNPAGEKGSLKVSSPTLCSRRGQVRPVLTQTCLRKPRCFLALILCISASLLCSECLFFCLLAMWVLFYLDSSWLASALLYSEICDSRGCLKCHRRKKVPLFARDPWSSFISFSARDFLQSKTPPMDTHRTEQDSSSLTSYLQDEFLS